MCVCVCVCVHERALHERFVCVRAVCAFSRACLRVDVGPIVCVRGRRVCAFTSVRCIDVSCACAVTSLVRAQPSCVRSRACVCSRRVCAFTSVRALRRLVCVCAVCVLSRALWTFGPFPAAKFIKYILILISINMHILIYN